MRKPGREPSARLWNRRVRRRRPRKPEPGISISWQNVSKPRGLLVDLRDLAARRNEGVAFQSAVNKLREVHAAKPSFLRRLGEAGL